ncbi:MAG: hypothetical protein J0H99_11375, partial [Rhodospirillales bacterium]|nr:hypothetical protein [Rhodospirillales bacterium]
MKLAPAQVAAFLRDPGAVRVVLLFGEDVGMIRDRAEALVRRVAGSLDDPFLVAELPREAIGTLPDEAASLALTGGRRVVRVREATDAATGPVQALLKTAAPALVVLEGAGLASRSRLRTLLEAAPDGVAIGCYPEEGRALAATLRTSASTRSRIMPTSSPYSSTTRAARGSRRKAATWAGASFTAAQPAARLRKKIASWLVICSASASAMRRRTLSSSRSPAKNCWSNRLYASTNRAL